jgi:precorrin isomerase
MARRGMSEAFGALLELLKTTNEPVNPATMDGDTEVEKKIRARSQENMNQVVLGNTLTALRDLSEIITDEQRKQAITLCKPLSENASNIKIRIEAGTTLKALSGEE